MRRFLALCFVVLGAAPILGSQAAPGQQSVLLSQDRSGGINNMLVLHRSDFYLGEPSASVPADAVQGEQLIASRFTVRAWAEGNRARVVVYAVVPDVRTSLGELETPIATYTLAQGQSARVIETGRWGAAPVVIRLLRRLGG